MNIYLIRKTREHKNPDPDTVKVEVLSRFHMVSEVPLCLWEFRKLLNDETLESSHIKSVDDFSEQVKAIRWARVFTKADISKIQ